MKVQVKIKKRTKKPSTEMRDNLAALGVSPDEMIKAGLLETGEDVVIPRDRFKGTIRVKL